MRIREGKVDVEVPDRAFYNPIQKLSRDIVIAIARVIGARRYCEPFAATGLRSLRMFLEAGIKEAVVNDWDEKQVAIARKLLEGFNVEIYNEDAHKLIRQLIDRPCDLVDLDQFGSPWRYIDGAIMLTRPGGILTFIIPNPTDLFGRHVKKCLRIYGSMPVKASFRFERGARIALLELSRRAAVFDRHIEPLITFRHKYYLRFVVRVERGVKDPELRRVSYDDVSFRIYDRPVDAKLYGGPAYGGAIWDPEFIENAIKEAPSEESKRFLRVLLKESKARPLYYDVHKVSGMLRVNPPKMKLLEAYGLVRTHFYEYGIRSPSLEELIKAIISLRL